MKEASMSPLVLVNFPLAALFILAWAGIPLWLVPKRPDKQPEFSGARACYGARTELSRGEAM
jgi:hypothetical protein